MAGGLIDFSLQFGGRTYENAADGLDDLSKRLGKSMKSLGPIMRTEVDRSLRNVGKVMASRHSATYAPDRKLPDGRASGRLQKRSGGLLRALLNGKVIASNREVVGTLAVPGYAGIHEDGSIVKARGRYMAIPLPAALDSRGIPLKRGPRDWDNTFVFESKKGNLLIARREATGIVPLYVLKTKVKIPPRLGLQAALNREGESLEGRLIDAVLKKIDRDL